MIATPSEQFRMLRLVESDTPAFLVVCVCSAAYVVARERFCSLCGALIDPAKGDLYDTAAPAARASVDDEPKAAEFDCVGIGERILAGRVAAQISLSTLSDELAIRADRLCRFEQGKVEDGEMAELLRALVWSAGYDSAVIDAYRKDREGLVIFNLDRNPNCKCGHSLWCHGLKPGTPGEPCIHSLPTHPTCACKAFEATA